MSPYHTYTEHRQTGLCFFLSPSLNNPSSARHTGFPDQSARKQKEWHIGAWRHDRLNKDSEIRWRETILWSLAAFLKTVQHVWGRTRVMRRGGGSTWFLIRWGPTQPSSARKWQIEEALAVKPEAPVRPAPPSGWRSHAHIHTFTHSHTSQSNK